MQQSTSTNDAITGCILGTAVGDAIGLPYEGVSRKRLGRLLGSPERHRFFFGRGMVSDDTEHSCMVVQSLINSDFELERFRTDFAKRLRYWLAAFPAGVGKATARACVKLWFGASPKSSGVFSAGNGPAMRSAIFGAVFEDVEKMVLFVRASAIITHSDPKAEFGAIAIALAAFTAKRSEATDGNSFLVELETIIDSEGDELMKLLHDVVESVTNAESTLDYAVRIGLERGVTGYTYHTVPIAIHAWLSHPRDYRAAVTSVVECGGDADTTAAIVGGIVGTATGLSGIPEQWVSNICEWPRTVGWMRKLAKQLVDSVNGSSSQNSVSLNPIAVIVRNLLFLVVVLFHGFRRLLPPY